LVSRPNRPRGLALEIGRTLAVYVRAQILITAILTAVFAVGFALLALPFWYLLAPVCGLLNFIPRFGALAALLIGALAGLAAGFSLARMAALVGVFAVAFAVEGFWLTPWLLGRRLNLRPSLVFLALLAGGALFGFVGLLVAVPVLAVALAVYRFFKAGQGPDLPDRTGR
jgi:predicted PurR-regulated permease PerM